MQVLLRVVNSGDDWQEINVQPIATGTVHSTPDTTPGNEHLVKVAIREWTICILEANIYGGRGASTLELWLNVV